MLVRGGRGVASVILGGVSLVLLGQALTCGVLLERPIVSLCYVVFGFGYLFQAVSKIYPRRYLSTLSTVKTKGHGIKEMYLIKLSILCFRY